LEVLRQTRQSQRFFSPFTGRRYAAPEIESALAAFGLRQYAATVAAPAEAAAERLAQGEIIGWFEGGSEWGPRALGARSIVANPLLPGIRDRLNSTIKFREAFRPFAVSGTAAGLAQMLDLSPLPASLGPYMLAAGEAADPRLDEVRHVDGSLRFQIVDPETQPAWHALIVAFGARTGVQAVLNTSFNTFGEPLVESPEDALRQFVLAGADALIIEGQILARASVPAEVWDAARRKAWEGMDADPLSTALGLEAAGYREAALSVLELASYNEEKAQARGLAALRGYHGLMHRAAQDRGDEDTARHHADAVLRISGLPMEALEAADYLAREGDARQKSIGRLVRAIAAPGDAYHFFGTLPGA
jgi:carbamoyltransferase